MWVLVTYDVNTETAHGRRRLRKVAQICVDHGQRVQKSVFECSLSDTQYERLRQRLLKVINEEEDSLRFYRLTEGRPDTVEEYGTTRTVDFKGPLVV